MASKFLDQPTDKELPAHSHKRTRVWKWLQDAKPGDGECGALVRMMRERRDMPSHFPHKTALIKYLGKCRVDLASVSRNAQHLYNLYVVWLKQKQHDPNDGTTIESVPATVMVKSGVTRKQIAIVVLGSFGGFSNPAENLKAGGRMADSAYDAADAIIHLFTSHVGGQPLPKPEDDSLGNGSGGFLSR